MSDELDNAVWEEGKDESGNLRFGCKCPDCGKRIRFTLGSKPVPPPPEEAERELIGLLAFAVSCWQSGEPYHGHNDRCGDCEKIATILEGKRST